MISLISIRELDDYVEKYMNIGIIDVRSPEEFQKSHIRSAVNIPYEEGMKWDLDRRKRYLLYCDRGATSLMAAREMKRQGYQVASVSGGIWEYTGRNLVFSR
ncbi:MAG: rhodanese-like domain-containing protein [Ruminococcus sp.]|nr:rhodanese-like domain-containing protein [Ruminococcus sp.]